MPPPTSLSSSLHLHLPPHQPPNLPRPLRRAQPSPLPLSLSLSLSFPPLRPPPKSSHLPENRRNRLLPTEKTTTEQPHITLTTGPLPTAAPTPHRLRPLPLLSFPPPSPPPATHPRQINNSRTPLLPDNHTSLPITETPPHLHLLADGSE
ncbi:hypothetical protein HAX54_023276 [Datura stramonium]|uniref:Uncharacterized protein n=1 Tax=Datura stramonium TaxID=4076 RepID=A0ABS8UY89_DATST|nr:hypothetical protein [Datura stramonium]